MTQVVASGPVGYMRPNARGHYEIVCCEHRDPHGRNTPIYHGNIYPYSQHCAVCGVVLVAGNRGWPELFTGKD